MTPNRVASIAAVPVEIQGSSFNLRLVNDLGSGDTTANDTFTATLLLQGADRSDALLDVEWVDTQSVTAIVPAGLPTGLYDLVVTGPYGESNVLERAFEVCDLRDEGCSSTSTCVDDDEDDVCAEGDTCWSSTDAGNADTDGDCPPPPYLSDPACGDACDTCTDADGDGWGRAGLDTSGCPNGEDCDDECDVCWPGHPEICGDGEDNDCVGGDQVTPADWWDPAYDYRIPLQVDESISGTLDAGYSVVLADLATDALIASGDLQPDGSDLRVVWTDGASFVELDRRLVHLDSNRTRVWFKTVASIDGTDSSYAIYYGNEAPGLAPAHWADAMGTAATKSAVYLAADDFEGETVGQQASAWVGSSNYTVELEGGNKVMEVNGGGDGDYQFAGDLTWTDIVVEARLRIITTSGNHYGLFARADGATDFDTLFFGYSDNDTIQAWDVSLSSPDALGLSGSSMHLSRNIAAADSEWRDLEIRVLGQIADYCSYDRTQNPEVSECLGPDDFGAGSMQQGRIGTCAGYPASRAQWDDFTVRKYVDPEPTVSALATEAACP